MKIVAIHKYGQLTFREDGGAHIENWTIETDESREAAPDELALMLYEYLANQTRERMMARLFLDVQTATQ